MFWSAGCSLWRAEGFSCSLCVLYVGLRTSKFQISIQNISKSLTAVNFSQFLSHQNPGFGTGSGSAIRKNAGSGSAIRKNAGSGSALNQCGSTTLVKRGSGGGRGGGFTCDGELGLLVLDGDEVAGAARRSHHNQQQRRRDEAVQR